MLSAVGRRVRAMEMITNSSHMLVTVVTSILIPCCAVTPTMSFKPVQA